MAVKWIFLWMGPGLSKVEVIHCLVRGRRTPENRPRCLLQRGQGNFNQKNRKFFLKSEVELIVRFLGEP